MVIVVVLLLLLLKLQFGEKEVPFSKLLTISSFVILEPVENIFALNIAVAREMASDVLYLRSIGSSDSTFVYLFQYHQLLWGWAPP